MSRKQRELVCTQLWGGSLSLDRGAWDCHTEKGPLERLGMNKAQEAAQPSSASGYPDNTCYKVAEAKKHWHHRCAR